MTADRPELVKAVHAGARGAHRGWRLWLLVGLALAALFGFFLAAPIAQDQAYHRFADERAWLGIANFLNVATNLPFAVVGVAGLLWLRSPGHTARAPWAAFFAGVLLVAAGSAYYHSQPDDARLVWDRLPMTLAFIGLTVALLAEWVAQAATRLLAPGLVLGIASVLVWAESGDLRLYFGVQLMPMVVGGAVLLLYRAPFTRTWHLGVALALYAAAKVAELQDAAIYQATDGALSGHPVKHVLAAGATFWVLDMLRRRSAR